MERGEVQRRRRHGKERVGLRRIDAKIRIYTDKEKRGWVEIKRYIYIYRKRWGEW